MKELLLITIGICLFLGLSFILNLKWTPTGHTRRLLTIKHLGDPSFLKYRTGNHKLLLLRYNLSRVKAVKKNQTKLEYLVARNHLDLNVESYVTYKLMTLFLLTIIFIFLLVSQFKGDIIVLVLNNANLILSYLALITIIMFADVVILEFRFSMLKKQVKDELPFFSTLFQMSIESGDNLFNALNESIEESHGLLKHEFGVVLSEVSSGIPFAVALSDMDDRLGIEELGHFVSFLRRVSAADYDDFSVFIEKQRISMLIYEVNLAKEYEKTIPQKLTAYNALTFIADFILGLAPVAFLILGGMNF